MQFLYLILSLYFGRRNPLFYLIFPIALVSGPGAFIDPRTVLIGEDIFTLGKNMYKDVVIIYLFIVVAYFKGKTQITIFIKSPFLYYGYYILFLISLTFAMYGNSFEAFNVMRLFIHMVLGFFFLTAILKQASFRQFISFFNFLFWATGILSILYALNSSQLISIYYQETLYQEIEFGNDSFFRDFATMPYFAHFLFVLGLSDILLKSNVFNKKAVLFLLFTFPLVLLYSFTRSLLFAIIIESALVIAIIAYRYPKRLLRGTTFTIGDRAIIGAGSIVTKSIPMDEIWAGNPAKFIRKLK